MENQKLNNIVKCVSTFFCRSKRCSKRHPKCVSKRRGALTMEMILIFPILMLLFFLFYQVSVMLLTYHSLQTTASHAAAASSTASTLDEITEVVKRGTTHWYYEPAAALTPCTNATAWDATNTNSVRFRVLGKSALTDTQWMYISTATPLTNYAEIMVEVKLPNIGKSYQWFWLLPQFKGVEDVPTGKDSFVVSALGIRE